MANTPEPALFSRSLSLVRQNVGTFVATQGIAWLVFLLLALLLRSDLRASPGAGLARLGLAALAGLVVNALADGVAIAAAYASVSGTRLGLRGAWTSARPRMGNLLLTALIVKATVLAVFGVPVAAALLAHLDTPLVVLVGLLAFLAAIILWLRWALALPVSVLENRSPRGNLRRSVALTEGVRLAIFGLILRATLTICGLLLSTVLLLVLLLLHDPRWMVGALAVTYPLSVLAWSATDATVTAAKVALYRDFGDAPPEAPQAAEGAASTLA